jgi:hypothetical protein
MSQQWERPESSSSNSPPAQTPEQLEAEKEILRNHPGLTREEAQAMLDQFF